MKILIYIVNNEPIENAIKEVDIRIKIGDTLNIEEIDNKEEMNYFIEELFNPNSNNNDNIN